MNSRKAAMLSRTVLIHLLVALPFQRLSGV
jgi:hypothetical protein